jgi:Family of unknown function (DUF6328)
MGSVSAQDPRDETPEQRDDRNLVELLQELRVAGLGVQVLFGFLLSLPFTTRFARLSHAQRELYITSILLAAVSTALLVAPVASRCAHRRVQPSSRRWTRVPGGRVPGGRVRRPGPCIRSGVPPPRAGASPHCRSRRRS